MARTTIPLAPAVAPYRASLWPRKIEKIGVVAPVGDGIRFSMYIDNMDWGGDDTMTIVKYNHTFRRTA